MAKIFLRRAQEQDLDAIMKIIDDAKEFMKQSGSPQWQDGHPNQEMFAKDIAAQINWVLVHDNDIAGTASLQLTPDPAYRVIEQGHWAQPNEPYATIHRVAISSKYRGQHMSTFLFSNLLTVGQMQGMKNFRLDTHAQNKAVQHIAESFNFQRRGIITIDDRLDPHRIAYELNLASTPQLHHVNNDFMQSLIDNL
ncbi:GNAT family N-acetyltransferase [Limosilactobacillus caccae]|uniref:GNAT family N-acetyltransferase n=1 Tax=Limosilactobacillus caccae TaxID=1926284 RepID=UPI0009707B58|nr:GNAT family N-acetyltransferase [Limosilactobacillus caccae]